MINLDGILLNVMCCCLLSSKLSPIVVPRFYLQPVYDLKKGLNGNIKKLIQQRKSMENMANRDDENVTFMNHTQEWVGAKNTN